MGQRVTLRENWEETKIALMGIILHEKFKQHPDLKQILIHTGVEELVEGNQHGDTFWGVCRGIGQNHLGMLLMDLRATYQRAGKDPVKWAMDILKPLMYPEPPHNDRMAALHDTEDLEFDDNC